MAYDRGLETRLDELLDAEFGDVVGFDRKAMFSGLGYLLNGNMCFGIYRDSLILRVGQPKDAELMASAHIGPMNITGKNMKGWVIAQPESFSEDAQLHRLCSIAVAFAALLPPK